MTAPVTETFERKLSEAITGNQPIWPKGIQSVCLLTFDMDVDSSWISRGLDEPIARSSGQFAVHVGVPAVLELLDWFELKTTFFTPGWVAETYPQLVESVAARGHEIGLHNFLHEPPPTLSRDQEIEVVERGSAAIEKVVGRRPRGYRSPIWQFSRDTVEILHRADFRYTSDLMDTLAPSFHRLAGQTIEMVNLPVNWILDDAAFFQFHLSIRTTLRSCADVLEIWKEEFRAIHALNGVYTLTMHPQLSGRPSRVLMLKELVEYIRAFDGVWMASPAEVADYWLRTRGSVAIPKERRVDAAADPSVAR